MKHIFVINPAAGATDQTAAVTSYLQSNCADFDTETYITTGPGDATRFVSDYCRAHADQPVRFYACGGDGTLNEVASGAVGFDNAEIGTYPSGSGNDYVKYFGGADRFTDIRALMSAPSVTIDLMRIGDRYCVNVCNFGFDTTVAKTMIKVKRKKIIGGKRAYVTGVVTALVKAMKNDCTVTVDGEQLNNNKILLCTIANGNYVGGSFRCAPRSVNNDGLLEVCLINKISRFRFVSLLGPYTAGEHLDSEKFKDCIVYRRGKHIHVKAPEGFSMSVDGEIVDGTDFDIEIMPSALRFALPPQPAAANESGQQSADAVAAK
ncbi:MAG: YegS/Rv2252/BmrU family lipid kinase [Eubacteriales bacterium]|nr:YegS/Rv2252/BmrU family lipid kinase [Eubacteriales bacterium]